MRYVLPLLLALIAPAAAQPVQQSQRVTPTHAPVWVAPGVIGDAGTAAYPNVTHWLSSLGVVAIGPQVCQQTDFNTASFWTRVCMGVTADGVAQVSVQGYGTSPPVSALQFVVDGTVYSLPGSILTIPNNTVAGNVSGGSAAPVGLSMPSCTDTNGQHLNWTSSVGFSCGVIGGGRVKILADLTLYVNGTLGVSTTCTAPGTSACAGIQTAMNVLCTNYDLGAFKATISVADDSTHYTTPLLPCSYVGAGPVIVLGNTTTPTNVLVNVTGTAINLNGTVGLWVFKGMKLQATANLIWVQNNASVFYCSVNFGSAGSSNYHVYALNGGRAQSSDESGAFCANTISGGANAHWIADLTSTIVDSNDVLTVNSLPTFTFFAVATRGGGLWVAANTYQDQCSHIRRSYTASSASSATVTGLTAGQAATLSLGMAVTNNSGTVPVNTTITAVAGSSGSCGSGATGTITLSNAVTASVTDTFNFEVAKTTANRYNAFGVSTIDSTGSLVPGTVGGSGSVAGAGPYIGP